MRENRGYHDRIASRYDDVYDTPYWRFYREVSWRHLKSHLPASRPALALDLGCGTGWFGLRLWKAGFDVTFLDPSSKMLDRARAALGGETRGRSLRFVQAGLEDMPAIAPQSADFATAQGDPLSFCADPARALAELHRVMRPGARVVLSVDHRVAGVRSLLGDKSPARALALLRTGRTEWRARHEDERFPMKMFDAGELGSLLARAGFAVQSMIGKTCLVQRMNEAWLADATAARELLAAEEQVHRDPAWWGHASHLQVAASKDH
jgi:ubiquinone/menaquinone biosynthesis C-methylase UbiE